MIDRRMLLSAALCLGVSVVAPALAAPQLGQPAPPFSAMDAQGHRRSLSDFKGKTVVLEWTNSGCPYVGKHYGSGAMQALQKKERADGVVWLTVSSSAPDMQGYFTAPIARAWAAKEHWDGAAILLDSSGKIGRAYEAKNTPHMFIIDKAGRIAYMGGIDDRPYADPESLKGAKPYVALALADLRAGRPVAIPVSQPYGCSVKYNSAE
jgi:peroxiredoxin